MSDEHEHGDEMTEEMVTFTTPTGRIKLKPATVRKHRCRPPWCRECGRPIVRQMTEQERREWNRPRGNHDAK